MAPSSYGAAPWQKVFGGTLFGGLSLIAAFLLREGGRQVPENQLRNGLDPKVFYWVMGGLLLVSIYMLIDILVHRYVITEDALEVYRPWGKQRILWMDIAKVRWRDVQGTKYPYPVPVLVAANGWEILYPRANLLIDLPSAEEERALFWNEVARRAGDKSVDLDLFV
jgi:hypothetical protein